MSRTPHDPSASGATPHELVLQLEASIEARLTAAEQARAEDVLPSLSRLMNAGVGVGKTREDHRCLADQLYACYARGREVRRLMSIVGENGLPQEDQRYLAFAARFESTYLDQGDTRRTLAETLDLGWRLLDPFPGTELKRLTSDQLAKYHRSEPMP